MYKNKLENQYDAYSQSRTRDIYQATLNLSEDSKPILTLSLAF